MEAPEVQLSAAKGTVHVQTSALEAHERELIQEMELLAKTMGGVKEIRIEVLPVVPYGHRAASTSAQPDRAITAGTLLLP